MSSLLKLAAAALLGALLSWVWLNQLTDTQSSSEQESAKDEPLYWVAPMDSNYRRDKPGKSPMGMDLIPVYQEPENTAVGEVIISPQVENNLGVRLTQAQYQVLSQPIETVGYVQYNQDRLVHIHPRVSGWVEQLFIKAEGEQVTAGQALYTLYSPQLVNAQEELLIALKRNNKALIKAAKDRLLSLHLSQDFIQQLIQNRRITREVTFFSKQPGVVKQLSIREGFYVNPGDTLMSIGQIDVVWVEARVFEQQAQNVKRGDISHVVVDMFPNNSWQGKVDYIYPELDSKSRTLRVRIELDNPQQLLKPNMFARVSLQPAKAQQVLVVERAALIRTGQQDRVVLALGEGKYKSIAVNVGQVNAEHAQILSGLSSGDWVVKSAQFLIDSESSKSSDFMRFEDNGMAQHSDVEQTIQDEENRATVTGVINHIDHSDRVLNISRSAIDKWQRPAATMDFSVADKLDISQFQQGQSVLFTFEVDEQLMIIEIAASESEVQHNHHGSH